MKNFLIFFTTLIISLCVVQQNAKADTRLRIPDGLNAIDINNNNTHNQRSTTTKIPEQYKGKIKPRERKEPFTIYTLRPYIGLTFNFSQLSNIRLESKDAELEGSPSSIKLNNEYNFDSSVGYSASLGMYSPNGLRFELEYSQLDSDIDKVSQKEDSDIMMILSGSPSVKMSFMMFNILMENESPRSKLVPYLGFGIGVLNTDLQEDTSKETELTDDGLLAYQAMIGLSYKITDAGYAFLGYRFRQSEKTNQKYTSYIDISGTKYKYEYRAEYRYTVHSIDLGMRFMF
jgi:hypothetical protein